MARYGDILEINGQLVEFTPVGYVPITGREGMLTKPAPTTKQTGPVGTPSTPPKQMPGESGPFDPNAPVPTPAPAPAPAPQQTAPVGMPSSDPTKTQPGETGPFDPNAEPPAPAPQQTGPIGIPDSDPTKRQPGETGPIGFNDNAVEEVETAPTDTPTTTPTRQEEEAIYPYMYSTRDLGSGAQRESWQDQQVNFLTQSQLQIEFNQNSDLKRTFGDFNNYLSYMNGMLALAEDNPEIAWWDIGRLDSTTGETYDATRDPTSYYYGMEEEDMRSGSTALIDANQDRTNEIRAALEAMNALPEYQQLLQDHNVNFTFQNNDGDVFQFNGLNSVEIYEAAGIGIKEITQLGFVAALSILGTPALASSLTSTLGAAGANAAASSIINVATQLITTGEVDIRDALQAGATSVLIGAALDAIEESGIYDSLQEAVGGTTTDQLLDADGNVIGEVVRNSAGEVISSTGVSANEWYTYATELGGVIQEGQTVAEQLSTVLDVAPDWLYDAGFETAEAINSAFEEARSGISPTGTGEEAVVVPTTGDIFAGEETAEQEVAEEDIFADTTQEATGFEVEEPGITEAMFQDVVDQVREDGVVQTQEIIDAINALGIADLPTLAQIQEAFPELQAPSLTEIGNTISTLLSNANLLTAEEFANAMAGVLTPEQLATALANLPYGDAEDFINAVANAGYATPENIAQLLNERDLMSNEDFSTYMEQFREDVVGDVGTLLNEALEDFPFPETFTEAQIEQLKETIVIPEGASMEQIQEALNRLADQIPAEAPTLEEMSTLLNNALDGLDIASPEDVRTALAEFNFSEEQIAQIINALPEGLNKVDLADALEGIVVGEDLDAAVTTITDLIGDLKIASTEDIRTLLSEYGFTDAQLQQISQAVNIPESVTLAELRQELDNLPEELTAQEVINLMLESNIATKSDFQTMLDEAFENFAFPETFTEAQIKQIKDSIVFPSTASMDQIQTALDRLAEQIPEAGPSLDEIQKLFTDTLGGLAIASPQDVRDALSEFEFSESQINQIINALPENISNNDLATALEGIVVGEDLDAAVTKITEAVGALNIASPEDIKTILSEYGFTDAQLQQIVNALPEGLSLEQVQTSLSSALEGIATGASLEASTTKIVNALGELDIASPQDVKDALAEFNFSDAQIAQIINALPENINNKDLKDALEGVVVGEDLDAAVTTITEAIGGLKIASPQDVRDILANYGFTDAQLEQIAGAVVIPPSATIQDVQTIVDGIPAGLTAEQVATQLSEDFEGLTKGIAGVQSGIDELAESLGLSTDGLLTAISNLGTTTGEGLTDLQTDILKGLGDLSEDLGLEISDVVTSVTDLGTDVADGIEGLGEQLTGIGEGIGGVQEGIDDLAEDLGLSTDALILAISNLGTATGEDLTELQTDILKGLGDLSTNLGVDIGDVVTSVTDLGTDVAEGIEGLGEQLTGIGEGIGGVQEGIDDLAEDLGLSTDALILAISNLGTATGEDLTGLETSVLTGLETLAENLGLDIGEVVTSVTDLGTDFTENIADLSDQLTGVEEAVGGVTTAVTEGVEDIADALGVQTDDIEAAIVTLGSGLGGELTELETNVLLGLTGLADSFGTDVETIVDSITGVGTGLGENVQDLSDTFTEQLGTGFGGIGGQLESGFGQLGQQLGLATLGLFGLGAKQPTAQEIAMAQDKFEFKPFEETARPRQVQQVVQARPVQQQPTALQQLNQFIDRQTTTPQVQPINQGMFTSDPNRKLA